MSKRSIEPDVTTTSKKKKPETNFPDKQLILKEVNANVKKYKKDSISKDPLLDVQWNSDGLLDRLQANNTITKAAILNILNQFGTQLSVQSENICRFDSPNDLTDTLLQVTQQLPWTLHANGHPDIANVTMIQAERKNHVVETRLNDFQ